MKSKKTIAIVGILFAVGLMTYVGLRAAEPDGHDHAEHLGATDAHDHKSCGSRQEADGHETERQPLEPTAQDAREIGLQTAIAGGGVLAIQISLAGDIKVNQDRMAHVAPRVEGVVTYVAKNLGDPVVKDEVIAVIESRELADLKAEYLAAVERCGMAKLAYDREAALWKEKIASEQEYLDAKQRLTEASIEKRASEQKLHAIGFDAAYLKKLTEQPDQSLNRFEIKAPFGGTVIDKHIVLGELVDAGTEVYSIADLTSVWVDLHVYPKDLRLIEKGQTVVISADSEIPDVEGVVSYIGPIVGKESRTAVARVLLSNPSAAFKPGLFVTAQLTAAKKQANVVVPKAAVQTLEGKKCVFVKDEHGLEPVFVEIGLTDTTHVEILSGLQAGQVYVAEGAFALKSRIVTSTLDSHAGHGH